jgi:hypothetical protein
VRNSRPFCKWWIDLTRRTYNERENVKATVYIETTIPSFYYERRKEPDMVARRRWTRQWWDKHRGRYHVVSSEAVVDELAGGGDYPGKNAMIRMMRDVPKIPVTSELEEIVESYIAHLVMPRNPVGDALHLALASFHKCDFLLTWNCNNLANANKFGHISRVNTMLGLYTPSLVTPMQLLFAGGIE